MKTFEEILDKCTTLKNGTSKSLEWGRCIKAMKIAVDQALDLAAERATTMEVQFGHLPLGFKQTVVNKRSILNVKDELK